jgi:acetate kinase
MVADCRDGARPVTLVLVVNAGSSSLKLRLLDDDDQLVRSADLPADESGFDIGRMRSTVSGWPAPDCVAHRVVHGGTRFRAAVLLDDDVEHELRDLTALAPLHQPKSLAGLDAARALWPDVRAVACFDTAFHAMLDPAAATYAVPREWRERWGVRRFGFHGLSHAYCCARAAELVRRPVAQLRIVTCHLGAGASLAAVRAGRSVDTTMGFTPLEGLVMATRSGTVDPGLLLWLEEREGLAPGDVAAALEHDSGLLALAGTADMREIEKRAAAGGRDAMLALDVFVHRLVTGIGAMAVAAGGIDVLAFTGGVGENSALVRARAAGALGWLGVSVDEQRNTTAVPDADVSAANAAVRTVVVAAREDVQMNHEALALLAKS